ncbi:MAG: 2-deoxystreptamine glucosyltransferase [Pelotomaculum sp. PtaB.Bin013]|nr:MAG: 2-deoxystreptamine glucosyltransferase [Pelotomaculum sp. PtaB.Bin013]
MKNKNERETIWFIHPYSVPPEYPASTRHYYLGAELAKRGWKICIWQSAFIHPLKRYHPGTSAKLLVKEQRDGLQLNWLWGPPYKTNNWRRSLNMFVWPFLILLLSFFQKKPRLIVGSSPHIFGALAGLFVSKIFRIPFIFEVRDLWPDTLNDMGALRSGPVSKLLYRLEKWLYDGSGKIVALTEGIKQRIVEKGVAPSKIAFIPNGIYLNVARRAELPGEYEEVRKNLSLENKFICVYTGAHGPANALDVIIDAALLLKDERDIVFLLVGEGQEKPRLMEKVKHSGLKNVIFHEPVPRSEIGAFIQASDLCILTLKDVPVFDTALPNKLFDYMYENKPILCALRGETVNLIKRNNLGVVVSPGNPGETAEVILQLKNNPGLLSSYGGKGRFIIEKEYCFEMLAGNFEELMVEVLNL